MWAAAVHPLTTRPDMELHTPIHHPMWGWWQEGFNTYNIYIMIKFLTICIEQQFVLLSSIRIYVKLNIIPDRLRSPSNSRIAQRWYRGNSSLMVSLHYPQGLHILHGWHLICSIGGDLCELLHTILIINIYSAFRDCFRWFKLEAGLQQSIPYHPAPLVAHLHHIPSKLEKHLPNYIESYPIPF